MKTGPYNLQIIVNVETEMLADKESKEFQGSEWNENAHDFFNSYHLLKILFGLNRGEDCLLEGEFHVDEAGRLIKGHGINLFDNVKIEINLAHCKNYKRIANFYRCYRKGFQGGLKSEIVAYSTGEHRCPVVISTDGKKIYVRD